MVGRGAAVSESITALATFSFNNFYNNLKPKQLAKSVTRTIAQYSLESVKTKITNQIPFYQTIQTINNNSKALKEYKQGLGILKITKDYKALLRGDLKNFYNLKTVQEIRSKRITKYNSLKSITYKNEYGYVPPQRQEYIKKGYRTGRNMKRSREEYLADLQKQKAERQMRNEMVRQAYNLKMYQINQAYQSLSQYGFNERTIERLQKTKQGKDKIYLTNQGSNLRLEKRLTRLNERLSRTTDYNLQKQRELMLKGVHYRDFIKEFDPEKVNNIKKQIYDFFNEQVISSEVSYGNLKGQWKAYNINEIAGQYNRFLRNMNDHSLKAFEIWLNPQEFYKQRYGTQDIKAFMKSVSGNQQSDGSSRWISWAAWIPWYQNSDKGYFMVKIKNAKSSRNPKLLYMFGEFWGTPSITKTMFNEIFTGTSMGENFWRAYFRKYGRKALRPRTKKGNR